jgi:2-oxopent-4-enoate/cis-2-oxohex-4-enoate hydratase
MSLKAGEIILSGSLSVMFPIQSGDSLEMEIEGVGKTMCYFD